MSVPCKNSLTNRELNNVYQKISDQFVKTLCEQIIDNYNATLSGSFSDILQNKMIEVLGKAETQDKMADSILQSIGTTLRHSTKGPYLLYALLNNSTSYTEVKEVMNKVFNDIYKEGDNKKVFLDRLARVLHEPHTGLFITQKGGGARTHKRRKTAVRRARSTDKTKRKTRSMRGGIKQRGGTGEGGDAAAAAAAALSGAGGAALSNAVSSAAGGPAGPDMAAALSNAVSNAAGGAAVSNAVSNAAGGPGGAAALSDIGGADKVKDALVEAAAGVAAGAAVKAGTDLLNAEAGAVNAETNAVLNSGQPANAVNRSSNGAIDASNSGLIANKLYFEYETNLLNTALKNLATTSSIMSTKMVNASYIYMLKNGQTVMDAVRSNIETSLSNQHSSFDVNKIIIIQALFSAIRELTRSIHTVAKTRDKIPNGFDPISPAFISEVISELLQNIQGELKIK